MVVTILYFWAPFTTWWESFLRKLYGVIFSAAYLLFFKTIWVLFNIRIGNQLGKKKEATCGYNSFFWKTHSKVKISTPCTELCPIMDGGAVNEYPCST